MRTHDLAEFHKIATDFAHTIVPGKTARLVTLSGELGAGKTTFVQAVARRFGVDETVASPTFVIEKIYELTGQPFKRLIHIDAYRLKSAEELAKLGWDDIVGNSENLILLEWPERAEDILPHDATRVRFDIAGEERIISINGGEKEDGSPEDGEA